MKNGGFVCGFGHINGETQIVGSQTVWSVLKWAAAGLGAAAALLAGGFLLGRKRRR